MIAISEDQDCQPKCGQITTTPACPCGPNSMWPASAVGDDNWALSCVCCKLVFKWSEWWRILFPNYQLSSEQQQTVKQSNGINPFLSENDVIKRLGEIRRYGSCCCHLRSPGGSGGYIYIYIIYTIRRFDVIFVISILCGCMLGAGWAGDGLTG